MGINDEGIVIRGISKQELWKRLSLEPINDSETSAEITKEIVCYQLPDHWYGLDNLLDIERDRDDIQLLSKGAELITLQQFEMSNFSEARAWKDGKLAWKVSHDLSRGREDLLAEGDLPAFFHKLKAAIEKEHYSRLPEQRCDLFFSIPVGLVLFLTGFQLPWPKHCRVCAWDYLIPTHGSKYDLKYPGVGRYPLPSMPTSNRTEEEKELEVLLLPALEFIHHYLFDDALRLIDEISRKYPHSFQAKFMRVRCLREMKKDRECQQICQSIVDSEANTAMEYHYRAMSGSELGIDAQKVNADMAKVRELGGITWSW